MTASDEPRFRRAYADLVAALGRDVDREQVRIWFEDFAEFSVQQVENAFLTLRRSASRYMPAPGTIREVIAKQRRTEAPPDAQFAAELQARGEYACPSCEDTGWQPITDSGVPLSSLEALTWRNDRGYRARVRRCACVAHNPVLAASRAATVRWTDSEAYRG